MGIAVGMASNICSFNLSEVCETTIALMKDPQHDLTATLKAPDFPGGGLVVYRREELEKIYETGRGSVKIRSVYTYDKAANCIDVTEIPFTTTVEAIIAKLADLVKSGRVREIADVRNEIGLDGLKITIDLKRGVDPDKLMNRLFAMSSSPACPRCWACAGSWRSGSPSAPNACAGGCISTCKKPRTSSTCSGGWRKSCWTSTRLSASSGKPTRRPRWCPT